MQFIRNRIKWISEREATEYVVLAVSFVAAFAVFYAWLGSPGLVALLTGLGIGCALVDNSN